METLWLETCRNLRISDEISLKWLKKLQQKMSSDNESHRYFHNWKVLLSRKLKFINNTDTVIALAIFFQYYEFDIRKNCTEQNCYAFSEFCEDANLNDENIIKRVKKLLGENVTNIEENEYEINFFQDLDLVILGSSEDEYKEYIQLLRKEYSHMDDSSYKQMRLKILETFLTIPRIYSTQEFHEKLEEIARRNIENEIEELKK